MIKSDYYLSNVGVTFDGRTDVARDEVEHHIQARYQTLRPNLDYIFQGKTENWQLNGMTPIGARAVASVGMGFHLQPNRLDLTFEQAGGLAEKGSIMDFDTASQLIVAYFRRHKPNTQIEFITTAMGTGRLTIGARNARFSLIVEEVKDKALIGVKITWRVRQDNVMPTWFYLAYFHGNDEYEHCCKAAFAACTNTFMQPDFFGLGLDKDLFLLKEKDVTKSDWWGFLSGVAGRIVTEAKKQKSMRLTEDSIVFITNEVAKGVIREAKRVSQEKATLDPVVDAGYN